MNPSAGKEGLARRLWKRCRGWFRRGNRARGEQGESAHSKRDGAEATAPVRSREGVDPRTLAADDKLDALTQALTSPVPATRACAVEVLGEFSVERATPVVVEMIHDPDPLVRCAAAATAGRLGSTRAVGALIIALDDPDPAVRSACADAIGAITQTENAFESDAQPAERRRRQEELKQWWKDRRFAQLSGERSPSR